ncbi:MAG: YbaB/EbfC family DNA-binding protein [Bacteroidetes bacterium]|nr:MAG: YbaB/EbfC family DNA-binding protein [Bacteroidota bacterium]
MFGKLAEAKKKAEEVKERLQHISVIGEAQGIRVVANGNRKIVAIERTNDREMDQDELLDLIQIASNRALEQADKVAESEMSAIAQDLLPGGLGGLGSLFSK